ncbi:MAG: 2-dehydro-3-deoxy-D-arabinonate dehydratase [Candidatus Latescibacterota bacterium]|jgi:2-dehydro-3-deoxy-D-arabinonate dehydratase
MKLLQFIHPISGPRLGLIDGDTIHDLTACAPHPTSLHDLYYNHGGNTNGLEAVVESINTNDAPHLSLSELLTNTDDPSQPYLISPVTAPDNAPHQMLIWLAGVTHEDSAKLREIEAKQATGGAVNVYDQKYRECAAGGIPELFSKSDTANLMGHGGRISHPHDTRRLVPETELVSVYGLNASGQIERLGYTGGNDYTDNGIEAENPLNLPQAKNWAYGCASLGPLLVTESEFNNSSVKVSCEIVRNGQRVGFKEGHTGQDHLNMPDGLYHLEKSLFSRIPLEPNTLLVFYWGTPIVFAENDLEGGLIVGDTVTMTFEGIGPISNPIVPFPKIDQLEWLNSHRK